MADRETLRMRLNETRAERDALAAENERLRAYREAAEWLIDCYEAIEYQRPVRNMDEAVSAHRRARAALGDGGER